MARKPRLRHSGSVTLDEVAQALGVSAITVSRALHKPQLVSEELRARILETVDRLGYVPNRSARQLASARSNTILVLIPSLTNTVFIDTLAGIEEALAGTDFQMLIGNSHYNPDEELRLLRVYLEHKPDGILIAGVSQPPEFRAYVERFRIPVVHMMDFAEGGVSVGFSQQDAGRALTEHLIERGYKRIAYMAAQLDERVMHRGEGYREALQEAGLYDPHLEFLDPAPSSMNKGAEMLDRIVAERRDCDAIFCCNDDLAIGAIARCQRRGIAVPGDIAIAGFNDLQPAAWTTPTLTTIATPRLEIGRTAARSLLELIEGRRPATLHQDLGFELRARAST